MVLSSSFPQTFSPDFLEKILLIQSNLLRMTKIEIICFKFRWIEDKTDQSKSNIFPAWFLLNVVLCYRGEAKHFSYWNPTGCFWRFSCTRCSSWKYKSALSVWLQFKISKCRNDPTVQTELLCFYEVPDLE